MWPELYLGAHIVRFWPEEVKRLVVRRKYDDGGPRLNRSLAPFDDSALPCCDLSFAHVVAELR